jgi:excinuclease UvrABC ATPase subunit
MTEEEREQRARKRLAEMPEDKRNQLMEAARVAMEIVYADTDTEVTPEMVEHMALYTIQRLSDDAKARFREVTDEEYRRIMDEEYERLCSEGKLDREALAEAVRKRVLAEYGHIIAPRRSRPPE